MKLVQTGGPTRREQARSRFKDLTETDSGWMYMDADEGEIALSVSNVSMGFLQYVLECIRDHHQDLSTLAILRRSTVGPGVFYYGCQGLHPDLQLDLGYDDLEYTTVLPPDLPPGAKTLIDLATGVSDAIVLVRLALHPSDTDARFAVILVSNISGCGVGGCSEGAKLACPSHEGVKYCGREHRTQGRKVRLKLDAQFEADPSFDYLRFSK